MGNFAFRLRRWMAFATVLVVLAAPVLPAGAVPERSPGTSDIHTLLEISLPTQSSSPYILGNLNGMVYFFASSFSDGEQLWRTDGTADGTQVFADMARPQAATHLPEANNQASISEVVGDYLYYAYGSGFYVTDGVDSPIIVPGLEQAEPGGFLRTGNTLYVLEGPSDWSRTLKRITTGAQGQPVSVTTISTVGFDYFWAANDGTLLLTRHIDGAYDSTGSELWVSDGTPSGTRQIQGLPANHFISDITPVGGYTFFLGYNSGFYRPDLWVTDGTSAGTYLVPDISPGTDRVIMDLYSLGDRLIFTADDRVHGPELWVSDGTAAGTTMLPEINTTEMAGIFGEGFVFGGRLFIAVDDGIHGFELWVSDGTPAGTSILKELTPGTEACSLSGFTSAGGRLYFTRSVNYGPGDLWVSNGTPAGTRIMEDFKTDPVYIMDLPNEAYLDGRLVFHASSRLYGDEVWIENEDGGGAHLLKDINRMPSLHGDAFGMVGGYNHIAFQNATSANGTELWISDGTITGTAILKDIAPGPEDNLVSFITPVGKGMYFINPSGIWYSDFSEAGTVNINAEMPTVDAYASLEDELFWTRYDGPPGLWKSGPMPGSFEQLASFQQTTGPMTVHDGQLLLMTFNSQACMKYCTRFWDFKLWASDGTQAGTREIVSLDIDKTIDFPGAFVMGSSGGLIYFENTDLWRSDGSQAGTFMLKQDAYWMGAIGRTWIFASSTPETGWELWVTDGSLDGTRLLKDIRPGPYGISITASMATVYGGRLYFWADDGTHGGELWSSDGTADGTFMVGDIYPGSQGSTNVGWPGNPMVVVGGRLFFVATDPLHGEELWVIENSDPTSAHVLADYVPGPGSSSPSSLAAAAGKLFFFSLDENLQPGIRVYDPPTRHTFLPSVSQWRASPVTP